MQEFPIKKTHSKSFQKEITAALVDLFGVSPQEKEGRFEISFGALERLTVWACDGGKALCVESVSRSDAPDATILDTNRRFREYLERVTGYTARERVKMAKKKVIGE
jgi:Uncharacterized protein conserved in archaea